MFVAWPRNFSSVNVVLVSSTQSSEMKHTEVMRYSLRHWNTCSRFYLLGAVVCMHRWQLQESSVPLLPLCRKIHPEELTEKTRVAQGSCMSPSGLHKLSVTGVKAPRNGAGGLTSRASRRATSSSKLPRLFCWQSDLQPSPVPVASGFQKGSRRWANPVRSYKAKRKASSFIRCSELKIVLHVFWNLICIFLAEQWTGTFIDFSLVT